MTRTAVLVLVPLASVAAQDAAPPAFPAKSARWVIRGKARVDRFVQPRMMRIRDAEDPERVANPRYRCNAIDLTVPGVLIRVVGLEKRWTFPRPAKKAIVAVRRAAFEPYVVAVQVGQELEISNEIDRPVSLSLVDRKPKPLDGVAGLLVRNGNRVFGTKIHERKAQNRVPRTQLPSGCSETVRLIVSESVHLNARCDVLAAQERAAPLHVLPHPVFAVTDESGRFTLPPLPNGEYEVAAEHELFGIVRKKVKIAGRRPPRLTFTMPTAGVPEPVPTKSREKVLRERLRVVEWRLGNLREGRDEERAKLTERAKKLRETLRSLHRK